MILVLSTALAGIAVDDPVPCTGPTPAPNTRIAGQLHTEVIDDGVVAFQRTERVDFVLGERLPWPAAVDKLSAGCKRVIDVPTENAVVTGLIADHPGASVRMVLDVETVKPPERKPPDAPREVPTVIRAKSGLGYFDLRQGDGARPEPGKRAVVEYTLWLATGSRVDSSYGRSEPFAYEVGRGQVIPGWEEGVRGMRVGGVRQLHVPWKLGYGRRGSPPNIPEKADLVFEVELLRVE